MQILIIISTIITTINAASKFQQRIPQLEKLAKEYYIGDIFQNIEIDIEYPRVLIFKGSYDKQKMKNDTRKIVNERLRTMTKEALAKSFVKLKNKRNANDRRTDPEQGDEQDGNHKRSKKSQEELLNFFNYFLENFDVDFVPETVYY